MAGLDNLIARGVISADAADNLIQKVGDTGRESPSGSESNPLTDPSSIDPVVRGAFPLRPDPGVLDTGDKLANEVRDKGKSNPAGIWIDRRRPGVDEFLGNLPSDMEAVHINHPDYQFRPGGSVVIRLRKAPTS